ncbi:hypothetical protein GCK72_000962 [Caenorhabditis remanei]|uniref:Uncharacterized protein n=1 Tax=Caenorhabditis remanei TaxID=31234 RepID=A0A6A5HMM3_CAERE|nr:hypothetical protein GCK72_000962 [Caenorhabditis remanei]KAF1769148.1 hypothetical protein GCK72_000962 [Caenorhabditis remanei]
MQNIPKFVDESIEWNKHLNSNKRDCIDGEYTVINDTVIATKNYKHVRCNTLAPKCGVKTKKLWRKGPGDPMEIKIVSIRCFPAYEWEEEDSKLRYTESIVSFRNIDEIIKSVGNMHLVKYILRNAPNETIDRYSHEIIWVENPPVDLFDRNNGDEGGSDAWTQYFSKGKITPIMLLYTLFICISVIIRLIWLVSVAWKSMKQGYEPVKKEKSKMEETVEDLD